VVFLAQRAAVPIVPIAISGTHTILRQQFPWYRRARVQVTIGAPFMLADLGEATRENRHALAQAVMARVAALLPTVPEQHPLSKQTMSALAQLTDTTHSSSSETH
jgi:1-acyl-sn-glycerol-3-phosphate acyltransferase